MNRHNDGRRALLAGTALAATLGLAGWAGPAMAQGFNGTGTVVGGTSSATIAPGNADITINAAESIINWNVTGPAGATDVAFLPLNNTVTFHETVSPGFTDYTVLNRVFPVTASAVGPGVPLNATINIGGTINSTFAGKQGGNVWFYSPHGIITSGNAAFNVGSLLLTTSDIDTSNGGSLYTGLNQVTFLSATDPNAKVQIGQTTTISAVGSNTSSLDGYVGIFAPRIEQGGTVSASGMVGYAAGEAGTITFNAGLVDVSITQGTDENQHQGIVHTGTTGTAAGGPLPRSIQMVAIPKSTALTMLLSGSIGYDAVNATSDGSTVVLSSGFQDGANPTSLAEIALARGNMDITNAIIGGDPQIWATGNLSISPQFISAAQPGLTRFVGLTQLNVGNSLTMDAGAASLIDFTDSLLVNPLRAYTGEDVRITSTGGTIAVFGDASIDATGVGPALDVSPDFGNDGIGGDIGIFINAGKFTVGNDLALTSHGFGEDANIAAGSGQGGSIDMRVSGGGTIQATGTFGMKADGVGGISRADGGAAGTGTGGVLTLQDNGGLLDFTTVDLVARGFGASGNGSNLNPIPADGLGGQVSVTIGAKKQDWTSLTVDASAINDGNTIAGNAIGNIGGVKLLVTGGGDLTLGTLDMKNDALINSGGDTANLGTAGGLDLLVNAGGKLTVTGTTTLSASALNPGSGNPQIGAILQGGMLNATVDGAGSKLTLGIVTAFADASLAGSGQTGGTAKGGQVAVSAKNGGLLQFVPTTVPPSQTGVTPPQVQIGAIAHAGTGPATSSIVGGDAELYVQGGTIDAANVDFGISAAAVGDGQSYDGNNTGFSAKGGNASVEMLSGGTGAGAITAGNIFINAKGEAVSPFAVDYYGDLSGGVQITSSGGTGQGGTARLQVQSGTLTTGAIIVHANGVGGTADYNTAFGATTPLLAGAGLGGQALVDQSGGTVSATGLDVLSEGRGGAVSGFPVADAPAPVPGIGRGGTAMVSLSGGAMNLTGVLSIGANAIGADGADYVGNATTATATAGALADNSAAIAELQMPNGSTATLTADSVSISATAIGGSGGFDQVAGTQRNGGNAIGGTARYSLADGGFSIPNAVTASATAFGGDGGTGGSATGGTAAFLLADTVAAPSTTRTVGDLSLTATPSAGAGTIANGTATPGTTKFTARAGRTASALTINGSLSADATGIVLAGDGFTGNLGAVPVQVNGDFTVTTTRDINMSVDAGGGINATGNISLTGQAITTTGTGVLSALGSATVLAAKSINLGGLSAGTTTLLQAIDPVTNVEGPVTVASLTSGDLVSVVGSSISITSPGGLTFNPISASAGDLFIKTALDLTLPDASAAGTATLDSGGALHLTGALSAANISLKAGGNILTDAAVTTLGTFSAVAGGSYTGALALDVPGNTSIDAAGGISLPALTSGGTTFLRTVSAPLDLTLTSAGPLTLSAPSASIFSPDALTVASATTTAGDLAIFSLGTLNIGAASSSAALDLAAGDLLTISGAAEGATITLRSPDIAITAAGHVGRRGLTSTIALFNTAPLAGTQIGGTAQSGVWSLDSGEVTRLFADQAIAIAPQPIGDVAAGVSSTAGPTTIGATALAYGTSPTANLGPGGQFIVATPGAITVTGPVSFTTSTNADGLRLSGDTIDVVTDHGSIALNGSDGSLLGTLRLTANAVRVGTASALSDLSSLTTVSAASTRLDVNDGAVNQAGTIQAGSLFVSFGNQFFIQNSGAGTLFGMRRGFLVNSLSIFSESTSPQIAINGVIAGPPVLTGSLAQHGIFINGALAAAGGRFDPLSTINGCVIGRDCAGPNVQIVPPRDTLNGLIGSFNPAGNILVMPVILFGDMPLFDSPPLIDEPVTGVGNDDLWQQH
jgi:filamentous hemagglutinin family protein